MNTNDTPKIITPNAGKPKKIVDKNNNPLEATTGKPLNNSVDLPERDNILSIKPRTAEQQARDANIIAALQEFTDRLKSGAIPCPEYIVVLPKFDNGETQLIYMGDPIPTLMLEGVLHKIVTRMALQ